MGTKSTRRNLSSGYAGLTDPREILHQARVLTMWKGYNNNYPLPWLINYSAFLYLTDPKKYADLHKIQGSSVALWFQQEKQHAKRLKVNT